MRLSSILSRVFFVLLLPCIASLAYLYGYPLFHRCGFPGSNEDTRGNVSSNFSDTPIGRLLNPQAPFRLLAFGDPQLEGDTSIPSLKNSPRIFAGDLISSDERTRSHAWRNLKFSAQLVFENVRKRIDLWGNDLYLTHIYRTMHRWTNPTHVTVLGDLMGSQWIGDEEFERRSRRFWKVFGRGRKVEEDVMNAGAAQHEEVLSQKEWDSRIINVVGNHDIGYAGDIDEHRVERWEKAFGKVNWDVTFTLPTNTTVSAGDEASTPSIHLVILNSMNLDTPALSHPLQAQTYGFINDIITSSRDVEDRRHMTILLTHIPLYKEAGICVDEPFFSFFSHGGLKEQNHLSAPVSKSAVLEGIFGMSGDASAAAQGRGRSGIIINGHDHEGCDTFHYISTTTNDGLDDQGKGEENIWQAMRYPEALLEGITSEASVNGIREVTLRSMMGEFGGNAALVSAWYDQGVQEWRVEVSMCAAGVQHLWWAIHVFAFITLVLPIAALLCYLVETPDKAKAVQKKRQSQAGLKQKTPAGMSSEAQASHEQSGSVHVDGGPKGEPSSVLDAIDFLDEQYDFQQVGGIMKFTEKQGSSN